MAEFRYRAFISYSHADSATARWLHRALEGYRAPAAAVAKLPEDQRRITPVFLDRDELQAAGSLSSTITAALDAAQWLIVVCSPNAARSRWVNEEVLHFKRTGRADSVLCVLAGGDPADPTHTFPKACLYDLGANGALDERAQLEPLAADLRRAGDGRRRALLKLSATILGVQFDELVQREAVRRQRTLALIALSSTAGMMFTAGLAIFALLQRNEAERQRVYAQGEATTLARTVDFLVDIFQVSNPATENPRNITALQILQRGAKRLQTEAVGRPQIRGRLMSTIGDVYFNLGLYPESRAQLDHSLRLLDPNTLQAQEARIALANTLWKQESFDQAQALYSATDKTLVERFPESIAVRAGLQRWWGNLYLQRHIAHEAEAHYRDAIKLYKSAGTDALGLQRTRISLANVLMEQDKSRLAEADALMSQAVAGLEASVGNLHADTAVAHHSLGLLRMRQGRYREAIAPLREAESDYLRLYGKQHPYVIAVQTVLGNTLVAAGDAPGAVKALRRALASSDASAGVHTIAHAGAALALAVALAKQGGAEQEARRLLRDAAAASAQHGALDVVARLNIADATVAVAAAYGDPKEVANTCATAIQLVKGNKLLADDWREDFHTSCPAF